MTLSPLLQAGIQDRHKAGWTYNIKRFAGKPGERQQAAICMSQINMGTNNLSFNLSELPLLLAYYIVSEKPIKKRQSSSNSFILGYSWPICPFTITVSGKASKIFMALLHSYKNAMINFNKPL